MPAGELLDWEPVGPFGEHGRSHRFVFAGDTEQAHIATAFPSASRYSPKRYAQKLLSVILGENMSSRLFQVIREEHGLCYEIQSDIVWFSETGALTIDLALSPDSLEKALDLITLQLTNLVAEGVTDRELDIAKSYVIGQSKIGFESTTATMNWAGECLSFFDEFVSPSDVYEKLAAITRADVQAAAEELFCSGKIATAGIGNLPTQQAVQAWLNS